VTTSIDIVGLGSTVRANGLRHRVLRFGCARDLAGLLAVVRPHLLSSRQPKE
jgi:hypothetical protein